MISLEIKLSKTTRPATLYHAPTATPSTPTGQAHTDAGAPVLQPHRQLQDNAVAESFFATLKNEMYYSRSFPTRNSAKHAVIGFIEAHCNRRRPHSTIGYKVPAEAMEEFFERTAPKPEELPMAA